MQKRHSQALLRLGGLDLRKLFTVFLIVSLSACGQSQVADDASVSNAAGPRGGGQRRILRFDQPIDGWTSTDNRDNHFKDHGNQFKGDKAYADAVAYGNGAVAAANRPGTWRHEGFDKAGRPAGVVYDQNTGEVVIYNAENNKIVSYYRTSNAPHRVINSMSSRILPRRDDQDDGAGAGGFGGGGPAALGGGGRSSSGGAAGSSGTAPTYAHQNVPVNSAARGGRYQTCALRGACQNRNDAFIGHSEKPSNIYNRLDCPGKPGTYCHGSWRP